MELWHNHRVGSAHTRESAHRSRVLTSTSGNAQNFAPEIKSHLDFRKPLTQSDRSVSEPQYAAPLVPLGSNDKHTSHARLVARKDRRSPHHNRKLLYDKPYLQNEKYLVYRGRKRADLGPDGKPVWPDHVEDSFQNALVHIPPMGKYKKSQHGRLKGRNQLVVEWIRQETGEERSRKQVSSHIQVLGHLLQDDPHWIALTKPGQDGPINDGMHDFYFDSIADQVRAQRQIVARAKMEASGGESWIEVLSQRYNLSKLNFSMWVGLPHDMDKALHNYTHLQSDESATAPVPLENLKNWRGHFPDLESILESSTQEDFEIVGIKSRLSLMSDFPPKTSKLGLMLSLDFRTHLGDNLEALDDLKVWTSVNHRYLNGQRFSKKEHRQCQTNEPGIVSSLAFEADWWATQFTKLTYKRKEAEDSKDEGSIASADGCSRNLFRSLTMMQEVYAAPHTEGPKKRMAVLLWVFSRSSKGHGGVTSWQRLVPPPSRQETNSPAADKLESSLPPLVMDSLVDSSFDTDMTDDGFSQDMTQHVPLSPTVYETSAYHSGFTPMAKQ